VEATYDMDQAVPNERLALFDRLWFSRGEAGPFVGARQAWRQLEADLEQWEQELEAGKKSGAGRGRRDERLHL